MIFVDLSHNERIQSFPDRIFQNTNMDMLVSFNSPTDDLTDFALEEQDLVVLGNPHPINETEPLFTHREVKKITNYVAHGGSLLLTSGARGDYNFEPAFGSLRVFSHLTGITQFHYTVLFHQQAHKYLTKRWNIVIDEFPAHPIFQEMTSQDSIVLGKSTYFTVRPTHSPTVLLSDTNTQFHNYATKTKQPVGAVPILTAMEYGEGRVVTVASSSFLTRDPLNGVTVKANSKLLQGICRWLFSEDGS
ncbi:MAG: hypothetical protein ACTSWW_07675 [Promethearchaeota archaeon]